MGSKVRNCDNTCGCWPTATHVVYIVKADLWVNIDPKTISPREMKDFKKMPCGKNEVGDVNVQEEEGL